jgi:hypothetical protein
MKRFFVPTVLALTAFAGAGTVPAFAQSSGWSAGVQARNVRPFVVTPSANFSGYSGSAYVQQQNLYNWAVDSNTWPSAAALGNSR